MIAVGIIFLVVTSTIVEMFKFNFVQSDDELTQISRGEKSEANEAALTEISLIELVRSL